MTQACQQQDNLFLNWLNTNRSRFLFQPIITDSSDRNFTFILQGVTEMLSFTYSKTGIVVSVMWQGECIDCIGDFDISEELTEKGWRCKLCLPKKHQYWPKLEEMWIEHCFERFLKWCNNTLAESSWLELYARGGTTSGRLFNELPADGLQWGILEEFANNFKQAGRAQRKSARREYITYVPTHSQFESE